MHKDLLNRLEFPVVSQLHVLRHFIAPESILLQQVSAAHQKRILAYQGSKFYNEFAQSPLQIVDKALELGTLSLFKNIHYSKIYLRFSFSASDYPNGIGFDYNDQKNEKQTPTWHLNIIAHRNKNKWEITTCFPGELSQKQQF